MILTAQNVHADFSVQQLLESRLDPRLSYFTIESEHFKIHFSSDLKDLAIDLVPILEKVHAKVSSHLGGGPSEKTFIVLAHKSDEPSIFTFVYPHHQIFVDAALPQPSVGLNEFAGWYDWLLTHEYTHMVHLDRRKSYFNSLGLVMGNSSVPNSLTPLWLKEGLAVFMESTLTPKGRGGSSLYRMMTRTAVETDYLYKTKFIAPDTIANFDNKNWPWTVRPYFMGYYLIREIHQGNDDNLVRLINTLGGSNPYRLDYAFNKAAGVDFSNLWRMTLTEMSDEAIEEIKVLKGEIFTPLEFLTETGQIYRGLSMSPNGDRLLVTRDDPDHDNEILQFRIDNDIYSKPTVLLERATGQQISFSRTGRIIAFDQTLPGKKFYQISDVYFFDLKTNKIIGASNGLRIHNPEIHPDGQHLVYVQNYHGRNRLIYSTSDFKEFKDLLGDVGYRRISNPKYSPDGMKLAFNLHNEESGGEDLCLLIEGKKYYLISDGAQNVNPSWSPDGKKLIFSSDQSGVFNIYSYDFTTHKTRQLTHVIGGLFFPVFDSKMNWIYVISYGPKGYDVARFKYSEGMGPQKNLRLPVYKIKMPLETPASNRQPSQEANTSFSSPVEYSPSNYMWPQHTSPSLLIRPGTLQIGLSTGATDPLFFENYQLDARYDTQSKDVLGQLLYFNGKNYWAWDLDFNHDVFLQVGSATQYEILRGTGSLNIPLSSENNAWHFRPGIIDQWVNYFGPSQEAGPRLGLRYKTEFTQIGYSFPESGSFFDINLNEFFNVQNAPSALTTVDLLFRTNFSFGSSRHAIHLSLTGGDYIFGNPGPNDIYSAGGQLSFPYSLGSGFNIYGFAPNSISSTAIGVASLLYTFPLKDIQRGWSTYPIYFGRLSLGLRAEGLGAYGLQNTPYSGGIELHQALVLGQTTDLDLQLGFYQGAVPAGGQSQFFLMLAPNETGR